MAPADTRRPRSHADGSIYIFISIYTVTVSGALPTQTGLDGIIIIFFTIDFHHPLTAARKTRDFSGHCDSLCFKQHAISAPLE